MATQQRNLIVIAVSLVFLTLAVTLGGTTGLLTPLETGGITACVILLGGIHLLNYRRFSFLMRGWWSGFALLALMCLAFYSGIALVVKPWALLVSLGIFAYFFIASFLPLWLAIAGRKAAALSYF